MRISGWPLGETIHPGLEAPIAVSGWHRLEQPTGNASKPVWSDEVSTTSPTTIGSAVVVRPGSDRQTGPQRPSTGSHDFNTIVRLAP